MHFPLSDLVTAVKYGPHLPSEETGGVRYLKARHFTPNGTLRTTTDSYVAADRAATDRTRRAILRPGQVILAAKGHRNFAWAYVESAGPCVASSVFYVLDVRSETILPAYLSLFMNTASRVRALEKLARGTSLPSLPKEELLSLPITVPPLPRQHAIVRLDALQRRRRRLLRALLAAQQLVDDAHLTLLTQPK